MGRALAAILVLAATTAAGALAGGVAEAEPARASGESADGGAAAGAARGAGAAETAVARRRVRIGTSVRGRGIWAVRLGPADARRVALVVGQLHGDERAGLAVARRLRRHGGIEAAQIWVVDTLNPDGLKAGTRKNARGVDLNRNFAHRWRAAEPPSSGYYGGPRPFSEPESRALRGLVRRIRPHVTVLYHQPWGAVLACRGRPRVAASYARLAGMRKSCRGRGLPGTATGWTRTRVRRGTAFVVEFPAGRISRRTARRHAWAVRRIAREGAAARARLARSGPVATRSAGAASLRPRITGWRIPYPRARKRQMAAYSKRHYGRHRWRLRHPKLIVQHFAVAGSVRAIWNTFAPNRPDVEYGELPGVCSHFAISAKGRIYKLVPVAVRCRHTVGLNHVAIGIEHVGFSDREVMSRRPQRRASLRLTRWLRCRFGIGVRRVIGHAESLGSGFYRERVPEFRGRTHSDFRPPTMRRYRRKLRGWGGC